MNAIELLETQQRDVDELFARLERGGDSDERRMLFDDLADLLAIRATLEEQHLYPALKAAAKQRRGDRQLARGLKEQLAIKRKLALAMLTRIDADDFGTRLRELAVEVQRHAHDEHEQLFPRARRLLDGDRLDALGQEMIATMTELQKGHPRRDVPLQAIIAIPLATPYGWIGAQLFPRIARVLALPVELLGVAKMLASSAVGFVRGVPRDLGDKRKRPA
jgi:hypothetical protein